MTLRFKGISRWKITELPLTEMTELAGGSAGGKKLESSSEVNIQMKMLSG